jgi:ribonuclease J
MVLEVEGKLTVIDCGLMFPEEEMLGIDLVLPDFTFLRDNRDRVNGVLLTHAHEDHIGALPYLLREIPLPIYGTRLTLALLRPKLEEHGLAGGIDFWEVRDGATVRLGALRASFLPVTHSVPHGVALVIETPQGTIVHSGDFKIDHTPVDGRVTDLARLGELGRRGVLLLMSDSTNSDEPGFTASERSVGRVLLDVIRQHEGRRIVAACFASHLHRVQQIVDAGLAVGRKVSFLGRTMVQNTDIAREMGVLRVPEGSVIDIEDIRDFDPGEVVVICTGSQGEPLSALALMAAHEHKQLTIGEDDVVILSSSPVPGNESAVHRVIDGLHRAGADVVHKGVVPGVHVSGHGTAEELKFLLNLLRPDFFVPIHGGFRHLKHHAQLAAAVGVPPDHILLCEDGDVIKVAEGWVDFEDEPVAAGFNYVDGLGIGDVGAAVLRDRRALSEEGMIVVVATVDVHSGELVSGPEIITRGWVHAPEAEELLDEARKRVRASLEAASQDSVGDWSTLKRHARDALRSFVWERTQRRPVVVPVIMEV